MFSLKKLFGSRPATDAAPAKPLREVEHAGFTIRAEPYSENGQFQTAGTVAKEIDGVLKEHRFVRADRFASIDDAADFAVSKGKQLIDQQGDRLFG